MAVFLLKRGGGDGGFGPEFNLLRKDRLNQSLESPKLNFSL